MLLNNARYVTHAISSLYICIEHSCYSVDNAVICFFIYIYIIRLKQTWGLTKAMAEMEPNTEQTMKLEWLYKVGSECELNSWPNSSVG